MGISDYVAIYAGLVATAVLIWIIWQNRRYLKFVFFITGKKINTGVDVQITNKLREPITIRYICFLDEEGSPYTFVCEASAFWRSKPVKIGDEALRTITLENEEVGVF